MTIPGDRTSVNTWAPLYPRHHLQPTEGPHRVRDLQVWPRSMRETDGWQELRRTAAVKHHLRQMVDRPEMLTTYEHDFGVMMRPNPKGSSTGFGASFYGTGGKPPGRMNGLNLSGSLSPSRIRAPRPWEDEDDARSNRSSRSNRSDRSRGSRKSRSLSDLGATARDSGATIGYSTFQKMDSMTAKGMPMRMTTSGWGEQVWSPKTHPSMIQGMTAKGAGLEQMAKIMNLRAADVPFVTR